MNNERTITNLATGKLNRMLAEQESNDVLEQMVIGRC